MSAETSPDIQGHARLCGCAACRAGTARADTENWAITASAGTSGASQMAAAAAPYYIPTALLAPDEYRWNFNAPGTPLTLTYGFMTTQPWYADPNSASWFENEFGSFQTFTASQREGVERAFQQYESVCNVDFTFLANGDSAQLRFGAALLDAASAAHAYYPDRSSSGDWEGDVWFNTTETYLQNQSAGSYGYFVTLHEIGHTLGLKHPFYEPDFPAGITLPNYEDNRRYTVMSYNTAPSAPSYLEPSSLMLYDIAALQYLYGANMTYKSGDDTWRWLPDEVFLTCIWDGGGNDTLDASNQTRAVIIDLTPGSFSSVGSFVNWNAISNLAIAFNCWIENAIGGSGNDTVTGNSLANSLEGGAGDDTLFGAGGSDTLTGGEGNDALHGESGNDILDGGNGSDTAFFNGARANYQVIRGAGTVTVTALNGNDGMDVLSGIDFLQFNDGLVVVNTAPVVVAHNHVPLHGTTALAATMLVDSVTDADGDPIIRYRFYDETVGNGRFRLNGTLQAEMANIVVAAGDLANFDFKTSGSGSDLLWVQAHDGFEWGAWTSFTVGAAPNAAPVVSPINVTPAHGTSLAALSLAPASDLDQGDTIQHYEFWDSGLDAASGYFTINGQRQGTNVAVPIAAADIANVRFQLGSVSDQLWVRVSDGLSWSTWKSFTVAAPPNVAATIMVLGRQPAHGELSIAADALFDVSDADGDTITKYRFYDGTVGNGRFTLNGATRVEMANIEINAADLANFGYVVSTTGTGDTLWVQAHDGLAWSVWKSFNVATMANSAPVVTVGNFAPTLGDTSIPAADLFAVSDADGDATTHYRFYDGTAGNGRFRLNEVQQAEIANILVDAADLSNLVYVPGAGADVLWVQAYDGYAWGAWKSFTASAPQNSLPAVIAQDYTPAHGTVSIAAASLFAISAADGAAITQYRFYDGTIGNGRFRLNGALQAEMANIEVATGDLANFDFKTSGSGSDLLWVQASSDGATWGAWKSFNVAAPPNTAPVVGVANQSRPANSVLAAASLFSAPASDPDGDSIVKYQFWDSTSGGGTFTVSGIAQAWNTAIEIMANQLAATAFVTGNSAGTDQLWARAHDGSAWGEWNPFNVTTLAPT